MEANTTKDGGLTKKGNVMMASTKGADLLSGLEALVTEAEEAKAQSVESPERKVGAQAGNLASKLETLDSDSYADLIGNLRNVASNLGGSVADVVDLTVGAKLAERASKQLGLDEEDRIAGFDADKATDLVTRWKGATGRRGGARGSGEHATPPSQRLDHFGVKSVTVTFDYPEGSDTKLKPLTIQRTHFSSVSNEIQKRAKATLGIATRPEASKAQWRDAVASIKDGGEGGDVIYVAEDGRRMVAHVIAERV